jgi:hypothetical protein
MTKIVPVDVTRFALDIHRDLSVSPRARKSGPPERIDGMTVGFVSVTRDAPHDGEVHPDGDEILYVLPGKLRAIGERNPGTVPTSCSDHFAFRGVTPQGVIAMTNINETDVRQ